MYDGSADFDLPGRYSLSPQEMLFALSFSPLSPKLPPSSKILILFPCPLPCFTTFSYLTRRRCVGSAAFWPTFPFQNIPSPPRPLLYLAGISFVYIFRKTDNSFLLAASVFFASFARLRPAYPLCGSPPFPCSGPYHPQSLPACFPSHAFILYPTESIPLTSSSLLNLSHTPNSSHLRSSFLLSLTRKQ